MTSTNIIFFTIKTIYFGVYCRILCILNICPHILCQSSLRRDLIITTATKKYFLTFLTVWFPRNNRFLGTYVSKHKWDFLTYGAYRCDYNRNPRTNKVFRYQCQRPIVGQYVSVKNFDLTDPDHRHGYYYYLEIAEIQIFGKCKHYS